MQARVGASLGAGLRVGIRILVILSGYLAANVAAGVVLFPFALWFVRGPSEVPGGALLLFGVIMRVALIGIIAILPTLLVIICAERGGHQSPAFYGTAGAIIGILSLGLYAFAFFHSVAADADFSNAGIGFARAALVTCVLGAIFGGSGCVGGLTYWLIAGRSAARGKE
jgi:hypothetical protein